MAKSTTSTSSRKKATRNASVPADPASTGDDSTSPTASDTAVAPGAPSFPDQGDRSPSAPLSPILEAPAPADQDAAHAAPASTSDEQVSAPSNSTAGQEDDFPALPKPGSEIQDGSHAQRSQESKGKDKHIASRSPSPDWLPASDGEATAYPVDDDANDTHLQADLARAKAMSIGQHPDNGASGASSSRHADSSFRRPPAAPGSPPKRVRANTAGDARPSASTRDTSPSTSTRDNSPRRSENGRTTNRFNDRARPTAARTRYRTADRNPPRAAFTSEPADGWRPFFGVDSENIWRNHPKPQHDKWDSEPHPKFLAMVSGGNGDRIQTTRRIAEAVAGLVNVDPASVNVGTPGMAAGNGADARAWLIGGLSLRLAEAVLDQQVLSTGQITLFFFPYVPPISGYLGAIRGLTLSDTPAGRRTAHDLISAAISENSGIVQFVRAHRDEFEAHVSADDALEIFIASIGVFPLELLSAAGPYTIWNTYAVCPTGIVSEWNELCRLFAELVITTSYHGEGRIHHAMTCNICPATDHPTPLCSLPRTPGWLGATPETIGALLDVSRAATRAARGNPASNHSGGNGGNRGAGHGGGRGKNFKGKGNPRGGNPHGGRRN